MVVLAGCMQEDQSSIRKGTVDQKYLQSEDYQSFTKQTRRERERTIQRQKNLVTFVHKQLATDAGDGTELKLPAIIDEELIKASYRADPVQRTSLTTLLGLKQIYHPLANIKLEDLGYYFFMTCKVRSYKDCLIWFASMKERKLVQIEMITTYTQTLSYSEVPKIDVSRSGIAIEVNKNTKYPLSTVDSYTLKYNLRGDGKIVRATN